MIKIGVFDSGVGGLTVLKLLQDAISSVSFVYFADYKNMPWGNKKKSAINEYANNICRFLIKRNCSIICIACHTGSAIAAENLKNMFSNRVLIMDIITPTIDFINKYYSNKSIGVIGTTRTIESQLYSRGLKNLNVIEIALPELASLVEKGNSAEEEIKIYLNKHLNNAELPKIDAIVLACTHYKIVEKEISEFYKKKFNKDVNIIDPGAVFASHVGDNIKNVNSLSAKNNAIIGVNDDYANEFYTNSSKNDEWEKLVDLFIDKKPMWKYITSLNDFLV